MARDRDHAKVAALTRQDGERLLAAWAEYEAKAQGLAGIVQCPSVWAALLEDEGTRAQCDMLEGHQGTHRHRMLGSQAVVTW